MGICPPQMPNMYLFVGPNGAPGAGSTIQMSECACEYMVKCIRKMQMQNLRTMTPKSVCPNARRNDCANMPLQRHCGPRFHETGGSLLREDDLCIFGNFLQLLYLCT